MDGSNITRTITTGTHTGTGAGRGIAAKATAKAGKAKGKAKAKAKAKGKEARSLALCQQAAALVRKDTEYKCLAADDDVDPHMLDELVASAWLILRDRERAKARAKRQRAAGASTQPPRTAGEVACVMINAMRDRRRLDARHAAGVTGRGEEVAWESVGEGFAQALVVVDRCAPEAYAIASQTGAARIARATPRERRAVRALFDAAARGAS